MLCRDQLSPKAVESLKDRRVVAISGGWRHTAAADDAGNLYTWGWNKVCCPVYCCIHATTEVDLPDVSDFNPQAMTGMISQT